MDRQAILDKIQAMMNLKESSTFEGEASAAAAMIDKLCAKYGVSLDDLTPQILDEVIASGRVRSYNKLIWEAVSYFYDAQLYYKNSANEVRVIGSEAQQIQVKLYSEFICQCMNKEAQKAYDGEKVLAELTGSEQPSRKFLEAFKVTFAAEVRRRLSELKKDTNRVHEHKQLTAAEVNKRKWGRAKSIRTFASGSGAMAGACAGNSVSLHRQASGSVQRQLAGG
jgi:hypothetical protein